MRRHRSPSASESGSTAIVAMSLPQLKQGPMWSASWPSCPCSVAESASDCVFCFVESLPGTWQKVTFVEPSTKAAAFSRGSSGRHVAHEPPLAA
jgi:hypothetical protein